MSCLCLSRRCKYVCCIEEQEGRPLFKVKVVEKGYDDLILTGQTPKGKRHLCTNRKWSRQRLSSCDCGGSTQIFTVVKNTSL